MKPCSGGHLNHTGSPGHPRSTTEQSAAEWAQAKLAKSAFGLEAAGIYLSRRREIPMPASIMIQAHT